MLKTSDVRRQTADFGLLASDIFKSDVSQTLNPIIIFSLHYIFPSIPVFNFVCHNQKEKGISPFSCFLHFSFIDHLL